MSHVEHTGRESDGGAPLFFKTRKMSGPMPPPGKTDSARGLKIIQVEHPNGFVRESSSFHLRAHIVGGTPPYSYTWTHNGVLCSQKEVFQRNQATLHSGEYCVEVSDGRYIAKSSAIMVGILNLQPSSFLSPLEKWISLMLDIIPSNLQLFPFSFNDEFNEFRFESLNLNVLFPRSSPYLAKKTLIILVAETGDSTRVFMVNCDDENRLKNIIRFMILIRLGPHDPIVTPDLLQYTCSSLGIEYENGDDFQQLQEQLYLNQCARIAPPPNVSNSVTILAMAGALAAVFYAGYNRNNVHPHSVPAFILPHLFYLVPISAILGSLLFLKRKVTSFLGLPYYFSENELNQRYRKINYYLHLPRIQNSQKKSMEIFTAFVAEAYESLRHK